MMLKYYLLISAGVYLLAWLILHLVELTRRETSMGRCRARAEPLLSSGAWKSAAALYKRAILECLDNQTAIVELVSELTDIYRRNGIQADLSGVVEGPRLFKEIMTTRVAPKERFELVHDLYVEIGAILDKYPGVMAGGIPDRYSGPINAKTEGKTRRTLAPISLKTRILLSFLMVIFVLSISIVLLGNWVIQKDIIERAERKVRHDLTTAQTVYTAEIERIGQALRLVSAHGNVDALRDRLNLHYIRYAGRQDFSTLRSEIARAAVQRRAPVGGTRIIPTEELEAMQGDFPGKRMIEIRPTPMARPTDKTTLNSVMAKEYAVPVLDDQGEITAVLYGGRAINRDYTFVDHVRDMVFGRDMYKDKPVGTVTIFLDDVRIATNVQDKDGQRAIGTRVSDEVYKAVVEQGRVWHERAFVVTDYYKSAYEPIRSIDGGIIGILYVGTLEQPFHDMAREVLQFFLLSVAGVTVMGVLFSFILAGAISKPLTEVVHASECLASGDWGYRVNTSSSIKDINSMAEAFNAMSVGLKEREESLRVSNEKLAASNKSYIDLIGFVAHELKGILASAVMNAYAVRDGYLGMINFKQRKAMDSVARNLDYLDATVKKFLNLGRIERGELAVNKAGLNLKKDVFDTSIVSLAPMASKKNLKISNEIDPGLVVQADSDLMQIVANNLVGNAIKYSPDAGQIKVTARTLDGGVEVEVYNDSTPMSEQQRARLFRKFSRLDNPETRKVKGTGLGLYITRQIIERHGGSIRVEPRASGNSFIFEIQIGVLKNGD